MTTLSNLTARKLPTTIGSIVTFTDWADRGKTIPFVYVATLLAGAFNENVAEKVVWGDSFLDGEGAGIFNKEAILAGNFTVLFEADENPNLKPLEGVDVEVNYGEVVSYLDPYNHSDRLLAIYAPGVIDQETGEFAEACWTNSYGTYASMATVEANEPIVYSRGLVS